uniref:Beta-lactamase domain-containing protein n=1 Tax=Schistocephalus solidus TaxID=70667 RepID=A0A183SCA7_SCHSO
LQNHTGLDLAVIIDGRRLTMVKQAATPPTTSSTAVGKSETVTGSGLVYHRISKFETVGFVDAILDKGVSSRSFVYYAVQSLTCQSFGKL